ncbi:hypothetical protein BDV93DRAFT_560797 [Ceratobasidium sp. AG-I]|nr:hypothetical protein BDV93DRAFT_560797 [Ceratobasidium sp. AG-I]
MPKDKTKKRIASETPDAETPQKSTKQPKNTPVPDPDLPSKTLKPAHTQWLEKYKEVYRSNVATRGTRSNPATDWVKNNITQPFIAEFFPDLSDDQKAHFAVFVWRSLYSWLHHSTNKTEKIAKTYSPSTRICTQWVWLVDHMDFVAKEWHNKCAGNPALMNNIGARRCFVLKLFQSQSSEVKRTYEEKCADIKAKLKMQGELDAKGTEE